MNNIDVWKVRAVVSGSGWIVSPRLTDNAVSKIGWGEMVPITWRIRHRISSFRLEYPRTEAQFLLALEACEMICQRLTDTNAHAHNILRKYRGNP